MKSFIAIAVAVARNVRGARTDVHAHEDTGNQLIVQCGAAVHVLDQDKVDYYPFDVGCNLHLPSVVSEKCVEA
jgi:hypothetical protein